MAKKRHSAGKFQDHQYMQIISRSRPEAEELLQKLGLLVLPLKTPYSHRMSAQSAIRADISSLFTALDFHQLKEKERVVAYYARPDIQREMHRYAQGRYLTVLRSFKPMYSELCDPDDILPLMFHYLKGNRWPSLHGTIMRYNDAGQSICDFVFEPDYKKNWAVAFGAARPIVQLFLKMGLPFFVKFSGSTSPHIIVPGEVLASAGEHEINKKDFRERVYGFVRSQMHKPGLLDGATWQPNHFLRLPYSIHELGGKVSMPIKPEEFDSFNPDKARMENVIVMEDWWNIPEDAVERGKELVQQVMKEYPRLVSGADISKSQHRWEPPEVPRKLRQFLNAGWYAKVLENGQRMLATTEGIELSRQQTIEETPDEAMMQALDTLSRWESAGMEIHLETAAEILKVDFIELLRHWHSQNKNDVTGEKDISISPDYHYNYYSRAEIQEALFYYARNRCFRIRKSKAHFRLQQSSDIPLLAAYFQSSDPKWQGFEYTKALYNPIDSQIATCDIGIEIDFSRSDYVSAVEMAQTIIAVLQKYKVFCFIKFDGNEILEVIIPSEALPELLDGQMTALQMPQIASGLNHGFRQMPEINGNDCILIIRPYGYTRPAYSINQETGLACAVFMPENLHDFSLESVNPARISVNKYWLEIPPDAPLQAQRFLKYVLTPKWHPEL